MNVTWAGIAAIGVLLFTGYTGYRRGFIKEIVSIFFVFLALALAWTINPYVNTFLMEKTSLYDKIQESCREFSDSQDATEGNGEDEETEDGLISQLPLPEILQKNLFPLPHHTTGYSEQTSLLCMNIREEPSPTVFYGRHRVCIPSAHIHNNISVIPDIRTDIR